ncbi:predicted protein [Streptomyces sp. AA4]|nr:predicted protein [Streptomyces sp. AA4]
MAEPLWIPDPAAQPRITRVAAFTEEHHGVRLHFAADWYRFASRSRVEKTRPLHEEAPAVRLRHGHLRMGQRAHSPRRIHRGDHAQRSPPLRRPLMNRPQSTRRRRARTGGLA